MTNIAIRDEHHWRALRSEHIGGSDVAAMFGVSPFKTTLELWLEKAGKLTEEDISGRDYIEIGNELEPAIARLIAKREGWEQQKVHRYIEHPVVKRLGVTLDHEIISNPRGPAPFEIKWANEWSPSTAAFRADDVPIHIELQGQAQCAATGRGWVAFGVMAGRAPMAFTRDRHEGTIDRILNEVKSFWASIDAGEEPKPDFMRDLETLKRLYSGSDEEVLEVPTFDDERFNDLCTAYKAASADYSAADKLKDRWKTELLSITKGAELALSTKWRIKSAHVAARHVEYYQKPYRGWSVTEKKTEKKGRRTR